MALSLAILAISASFLIVYATNEYHCIPNQPCTIDCANSSSCAGKALYCPSNHECIINCDLSPAACQDSTIYARDSSFLSITITNTNSITIYAPSSNTNTTKSIITCNTPSTTNSTFDQCQNLKIYATRGFNDVDLRCTDTSSSCNISGSMQCGYDTQYTYDECTNFQYISSDIGYQCQDSNFCQFRTSSSDRTMPAISMQNESISDEKQIKIEDLYLVIIGAVVIFCVVLMVAGCCGFCYVRLRNNEIEDPSPSLKPKLDAIDSNETADMSDDRIVYGSAGTASSYTANDDRELSTSDALGLTAKYIGIVCDKEEGQGYIDKSKSIQDSISPNSLLDVDLEPRNEHNYSSSSRSFFGELTPTERGKSKSRTETPKLDAVYSPSADAEEEEVEIEDGIILTTNDHGGDGGDGTNETTNIILPNLPRQQPSRLHTIAEYEPDQLTEQQRAIRMQNIMNIGRSYGYQQPEILYEDDENFTEEDTESSSRLSMDQKEMRIVLSPQGRERSTISISRDGVLSPKRKATAESRKIAIERRKASTVTNDGGAYTLSLKMSHEILSDDEELPSLPGKPVAFLFSEDDGDREYCD